jgi:hypothetical protein
LNEKSLPRDNLKHFPICFFTKNKQNENDLAEFVLLFNIFKKNNNNKININSMQIILIKDLIKLID